MSGYDHPQMMKNETSRPSLKSVLDLLAGGMLPYMNEICFRNYAISFTSFHDNGVFVCWAQSCDRNQGV